MATKSHSTPDLFASKMACEQSKPQMAEHYISAPIYLSVLVTVYDSAYYFFKRSLLIIEWAEKSWLH